MKAAPAGWQGRLTGPGRRRLRTLYVVAAAGLAALVPLILFAGFWVRSELNKSQRDVDLFLTAGANTLSQRVDAEIQQQLSALRAISALPSLDSDPAVFETAARRITGMMPHWSVLSLVDAIDGRVVFSTTPGGIGPVSPTQLERLRSDRLPLVESRPEAAGAGGGILLYYPVVRNDRVENLLVTTLDSRDIQQIAEQQARDASLVSVIIDRGSRILARSLEPGSAVGQEASAEFKAAAATTGRGMYIATSREGEPITSAFVRSDLTGWVSVASMNRRQVDRMSTRTVWATIAAGALSLVLAGILTVFIVHNVMERRVSDERLAASRALGDLDARLLATTQEALTEQRKASSEREVLLREIYHRVKNNLQIVQSLLRLGSRDLRPDQREPFENAVRRIGAMARVHTLLYNSPDLASIDFKEYLDELLKELSEGFAAEERAIHSVLQAEAMRMPLDTAVPLAFIAVEILTNSFKHAFPDNRSGRITVEVHRSGGTAKLTIRDDGIGLAAEQPGKRRLGLTIVRKLVQQIGGTLEEPSPGSSTFVVTFPIPEGEDGQQGSEREPVTAA